jgi:hypothetical protein
MKISTFLLFLALVFVAGVFCLGSPMFSGGVIGIILMASLIFYFAGGIRTKT